MEELKRFFIQESINRDNLFTNEDTGDCSIYLWINKDYTNCYIGFYNNSGVRNHKNKTSDLVKKIQKDKNWSKFYLDNLSFNNAHVLEAYLIKYVSITYGLHSYSDTTIIKGKALNKRRELSWEKQISKILINGSNFKCIARGESYNN